MGGIIDEKSIFDYVFCVSARLYGLRGRTRAGGSEVHARGGGKYIYCNNEEGIFLSTLADSTTDEPSYIMNNYDLTPDKYIIYLSHFNYTHTSDNSYNALERGFDVELDVEIYATEDTEIVINRTAFEFPANIYTENNGNISRSYAEYGSIKRLRGSDERDDLPASFRHGLQTSSAGAANG